MLSVDQVILYRQPDQVLDIVKYQELDSITKRQMWNILLCDTHGVRTNTKKPFSKVNGFFVLYRSKLRAHSGQRTRFCSSSEVELRSNLYSGIFAA